MQLSRKSHLRRFTKSRSRKVPSWRQWPLSQCVPNTCFNQLIDNVLWAKFHLLIFPVIYPPRRIFRRHWKTSRMLESTVKGWKARLGLKFHHRHSFWFSTRAVPVWNVSLGFFKYRWICIPWSFLPLFTSGLGWGVAYSRYCKKRKGSGKGTWETGQKGQGQGGQGSRSRRGWWVVGWGGSWGWWVWGGWRWTGCILMILLYVFRGFEPVTCCNTFDCEVETNNDPGVAIFVGHLLKGSSN